MAWVFFIVTILFCLCGVLCATELDVQASGELRPLVPEQQQQKQRLPFERLKILVPPSSLAMWKQFEYTESRKVDEADMPPIMLEMKAKYGNCVVDYSDIGDKFFWPAMTLLPSSLAALEIPKIHWQVITGEQMLIPHVDNDRITVINVMIQTNNERTVFYTNATKFFRVPVLNNKIYDLDWITPYAEFTANEGDVYLLNTREIHSVLGLTGLNARPRVSLSYSFRRPFEEVLSHFNQ